MNVIATAGHVDHGKSSLILALTGTDPDRFEEEKRRGLTIDLGFAHMDLPSGARVSFVDVPGHVRFLRNMLAGVGAIDACLFVVAATEGWKPQSEEHLRILDLLGVTAGIIALTKVDLVDDEWREIAMLDVLEHCSGSFLADAPIVPVAAPTGNGLAELRRELDHLVATIRPAEDLGRPRLWVDRVFAATGSGTVVTGTLVGGSIAVGDHVLIASRTGEVRVRGIQMNGSSVDRAGPGTRAALNLAGVEHSDLHRGDAVVTPRRWLPTARFDATLDVVAALTHHVSRRGAYAAYIGSGEFEVKVRVLGDDAIEPGGRGLVRLHLDESVPLLPGDRYILRESGRNETVGGGEVLDIHPVLPASKARPDRDEERLLRELGWTDATRFSLLTGTQRPPTIGRWLVTAELLESTKHAVRERVLAAGPSGFHVAGLDEHERAVLAELTDIVVENGVAHPVAASGELAGHPFVATLLAAGFAPPDTLDIDRDRLRQLVRRGIVVEREGMFFHAATVDAAARIAADLLRDHPIGFTLAQFRDATGSTRRHALPLANELDARGVTRRRGDLRVGGPRLPIS